MALHKLSGLGVFPQRPLPFLEGLRHVGSEGTREQGNDLFRGEDQFAAESATVARNASPYELVQGQADRFIGEQAAEKGLIFLEWTSIHAHDRHKVHA